MIRTSAVEARAHGAGLARLRALGTWYVQAKLDSGPAFKTANARRPSEPPT
jgi:hypothetical protein